MAATMSEEERDLIRISLGWSRDGYRKSHNRA